MIPDLVQKKLETLPSGPGCYLFRDRAGKVVYVGKASNLRSRVSSYFHRSSSDVRYFVQLLDRVLGDLDTLVVETEKEAALLEDQLIKQHQPRYNVKLRDDKSFLSIRLDRRAEWPRLELVRRPSPDGAEYFGPYHSATSARRALRTVNRHFKLRTCTDEMLRSRVRPCLEYQIKRCPGMCVFDVPEPDYAQQVHLVSLFLAGRRDELTSRLERAMRDAAEHEAYELAATYRDQLWAMQKIHEEQRIAVVEDVDRDVIGLHREAELAEVAWLAVREGRVTSVQTFPFRDVELPDAELVASFVTAWYGEGNTIPDELLLPVEIESQSGVAELLSDRKGRRVAVIVPKRGARVDLVALAHDNARHAFEEQRRAEDNLDERLSEVQRRLQLASAPRRIECIDVSHMGGEDTVASIVALTDGKPDRKRYKSFRLRGVSGGDDYGAMHEVLSRRLARAKRGEAGWELPDLLVVDGGRGQLGVALAVLRDLGITGLDVVGLAKEKPSPLRPTKEPPLEDEPAEKLVDRAYLPGRKNPVALREHSASLFLLALARDEAHRASNLLRTRVGKRRRFKSALDDLPGVGPKTRAALLKRFGSLRRMTGATVDEIAAVAGVSRRAAEAVVARLAAKTPPPDEDPESATP
ncbi:MAG: excinuclease ABC subunit UvrC [Deltaproteobacteria bacterium]|nr:excinuclease ABC subunit UvrC [Deltaproteobacteria bacterium]